MAPELFGIGEGTSGLSTHQSDVFALGMVAFEVGNVYYGELLHDLNLFPLVSSLRCSPDKCRSQRIRLRRL